MSNWGIRTVYIEILVFRNAKKGLRHVKVSQDKGQLQISYILK